MESSLKKPCLKPKKRFELFPDFFLKNLRKALAYAMDRQAIVDHVTQGNQIPATGIVPNAMKLHKEPLFIDHDLNAAQTHFDQALDELDATADSLPVIPLLYASAERNHLMAQAIQD